MSQAVNLSTIDNIVETSIRQSVGSSESSRLIDSTSPFMGWLVETGQLVPPWWSKARDRKLAAMWKESNHLSIAVYNTQARIVGIPPKIVPRDRTIAEHWEEAESLWQRLFLSADFGRGWEIGYSKFVEDLITQDNGGFMEIIGDGPPDGPIIGAPLTVRHLDAFRCTRTGHPVYPVIYEDDNGQRFKIHYTRIIAMSQMPSSRATMNGVGFCAVSRSVEIAQTLIDIIRYKQERLGSRPHNQMIVGKGITATQIMLALRKMEEELSNRGFQRYARTIAIGSENTDIDIDVKDLTHMNPFDEEISVNLGMYAIASAFGMDAEELWPVGGKSLGKAEANLRRMRARGKLPTQVTSELSALFNLKVLPRHLMLEFDFRDDDEDMQQANIKDIRGRNRERDIGTGAINIRGARTRMLEEGDIDRPTFIHMELADGRLQNGISIATLFFTPSPPYDRLLGFMDNPLSIVENITNIDEENGTSIISDAKLDMVLMDIQKQRAVVLAELALVGGSRKALKVEQCLWALDWLEQQYEFAAGRVLPPVPMHQRRQRTDIRIVPAENSPDQGEASAAEQAASIDENVEQVGIG